MSESDSGGDTPYVPAAPSFLPLPAKKAKKKKDKKDKKDKKKKDKKKKDKKKKKKSSGHHSELNNVDDLLRNAATDMKNQSVHSDSDSDGFDIAMPEIMRKQMDSGDAERKGHRSSLAPNGTVEVSELNFDGCKDINEAAALLQKTLGLSPEYGAHLLGDLEEVFDKPSPMREMELQGIYEELKNARYVLVDRIGAGAFGSVWRGYDKKDNRDVAIKIIDFEESMDDIQTIVREINALASGASCEQLTAYYGSEVRGTKLWIIMELVDISVRGILDKVGPLPEKYAAIIIREVLLALLYLAQDKKIHRDLKGANILMKKDGSVKLGDFGASNQLTESMGNQLATMVGSPYWMAPEIMTSDKYDAKVDVWSLGITAVEIVMGKPPRHDVSHLQIMSIISSRAPPKVPTVTPKNEKLSSNFQEFVKACLVKDPKKRSSINELVQMKWITKAKKTRELRKVFKNLKLGGSKGSIDQTEKKSK